MKFSKLLYLLLALGLVLSCLHTPVRATTEATDASTVPSVTEPTETAPAPATEPQESSHVASDLDFHNYTAQGYAGPQDYTVDAKGAMLIELSTQSIAYAMNPDERLYPASLTKVMTCLLALERGNLSDTVTVSDTALDDEVYGYGLQLEVNEEISLESLLFGLMVDSANDSSRVIAEHISGTVEDFVTLMNQKAQELGCKNTHFVNPHGLHDDNHYTTVRDMAMIFMAAMEYDKFQELYQTTRYVIPPTNLSDERIIVTTNYLCGTIITSQYYDKRVVGGKTGFTTPAGRCVACVAESGEDRYLCVVMGATNENDAGESPYYGAFVEASKLLDYGFDAFAVENILSPLSPVAQLAVAEAVESVVVVPGANVTTILPSDFDKDTIEIRYSIQEGGLIAPLEAGQAVGTVGAYIDGVCVASTDLVTMTAVERHAIQAQINETTQKLAASPWKIVMIVCGVLLAVLLLLVIRAQILRYLRKKRRAKRRKVQS